MSQTRPPISWMLWHPHQGFWNQNLIQAIRKYSPLRIIYLILHVIIIQIDTFLLCIRVIVKRVQLLGFLQIFARATLSNDQPILYLDIGTHKEGAELSWMVNNVLPSISGNFKAYGFEASLESFEYVGTKFANKKDVQIVHNALCYDLPSSGKIRLYRDEEGGIGDSLYRETEDYEDVDAIRLSDFLEQNKIDLEGNITLLRMNIEGAEFDVIKDIVESGHSNQIDGYFGMWDDLSKIDLHSYKDFLTFLTKHHIDTFPFNGRDLMWFIRKKCIAYHIHTCILKSLPRV